MHKSCLKWGTYSLGKLTMVNTDSNSESKSIALLKSSRLKNLYYFHPFWPKSRLKPQLVRQEVLTWPLSTSDWGNSEIIAELLMASMHNEAYYSGGTRKKTWQQFWNNNCSFCKSFMHQLHGGKLMLIIEVALF